MRYALISSALALLLFACGGTGSNDTCTGSDCPAKDGGALNDTGSATDTGRDVAADRSVRDSALKGDSGDASKSTDGGDGSIHEAASEAAFDAGPRCAAKPTLLVNATTWVGDGADGIQAPSVALSATDVYYVLDLSLPCFADGGCSASAGSIWMVPVGGGPSSPVVTGLGYITSHFVTTSTSVVFGAYETPGSSLATGYVYSVPLAGGATTTLATAVGGAGYVATDGTNAYFSDNDGVKRVALSGGPTDLLTTDDWFSFAPIAGNLVLADFSGGLVASVSLDGGAPTTLAAAQLGPLYPVGCGSAICWANAGDEIGGGGLPGGEGDIVQLVLGSTTPLSTSGSLFEPTGLVYDGDNFFVTAGGGPFGDLMRVPGTGGAPVSLVTYPGSNGAAVDESCVYWADPLGGVYSLIKTSPGGFSVK